MDFICKLADVNREVIRTHEFTAEFWKGALEIANDTLTKWLADPSLNDDPVNNNDVRVSLWVGAMRIGYGRRILFGRKPMYFMNIDKKE